VSTVIQALAGFGLRLNRTWSCEFAILVRKLGAVQPIPLSPHLKSALVLGEDRRFFNHIGIDLISTCRATFRTILLGRLEGASTIEQQLIRVSSGRYERTLRRKIREIVMAVSLSRRFSKEEILTLYLRCGFYGWKMAGLEPACKVLAIDVARASAEEAAALVARLKYPEPRFGSRRQARRIERRRSHILALMKRRAEPDLTKSLSVTWPR